MVSEEEEKLVVQIKRSKTDGAGQGFVFFVLANKSNKDLCPFSFSNLYLKMIPTEERTGRLFRKFGKDGQFIEQVLGKSFFSDIPKIIAAYLGKEDADKYTVHCIRHTGLFSQWLDSKWKCPNHS